jgi:DNA processing protein
MPVGYKPVASNFITRNRVVAGLSAQLILGEADENSGSVATANFMLELGRPLWAIPSHPSDERSVGPNRFIAAGRAKLCSGASDFFATPDKKDGEKEKNKIDSALLDFIGGIPVSENVLTVLAKKNISEVACELVRLELNGFIKKTADGYIRV